MYSSAGGSGVHGQDNATLVSEAKRSGAVQKVDFRAILEHVSEFRRRLNRDFFNSGILLSQFLRNLHKLTNGGSMMAIGSAALAKALNTSLASS